MDLVRRWLDRIGFLGVSSGVVVAGFLQGNYLLTFRLELAVFVLVVVLLQAVMSSLVFTGVVSLSSLLFLLSARREQATPRSAGPTVTAIVPVYRDAAALHRSVESLRASDYENLDICVVCEPDDHRSRRRASGCTTAGPVRSTASAWAGSSSPPSCRCTA
jgi:hypothetical protein